MNYSITHIGDILKSSRAVIRSEDAIEYLLTDSRKLLFPAKTLFFALKGPRRNGDLFIKELYEREVRNFVVPEETPYPELADANFLYVPDVLEALQRLAAYHRSRFGIPVIGITGSNGKTIVKEWLNQLLEDRYHIVRSPRSYNSQIGVPLSVWQLGETNELGIFEAGISRPGEMQKLEEIIQPTIGILTNIGEAHGENFEDDQIKLEEKITLFKRAGAIICPADREIIIKTLTALSQGSRAELFTWGVSRNATALVKAIVKNQSSTTIDLVFRDQGFSVSIPFTDDASVENCMACISTLLYLQIPVPEIKARLPGLSPIAMRLELKSGINRCTLINDSYSADLSSLKIALDFLEQQDQHGKRTVILSDILQSGKAESRLYQEIASSLKQKKINRLIGIGEKMTAHQDLFRQQSIKECLFYPSAEAFSMDFQQLSFKEETILIKGARVFAFEKVDALLTEQIHQTVLEINLTAMTHNLKQYQQLLWPSTKLMAMVKAFAYGGGSYEIANLLQFHKLDYLAVAYTDEAVELRKAGINMPIMVMNAEDSSFESLVHFNLEPVIYSFRFFHLFDRFLKKEGLQLFPVHIELETGMNRLGFPKEESGDLIRELRTSNFKVQSVFSHLAASEEVQQDIFTREQAALYILTADQIQSALDYPFLRHISNSAAIVRHPELQFDMVRLGIGLYGIDSASSRRLDLQEAQTLKSTIAQIKYLRDGETVGYNRKGVATGDRVMATIRIGYADGYPRILGNGNGKCWIKGHLAPVLGSVCMDMTMIDISGIPDVQEGDEVIVFGGRLSVKQVAHWANTIPYEILTGISQRVKRVYYEE